MSISVSVIVPSYNHALFLRKRLESIFTQTYPDYEVILLDDASKDNSLEVLRAYKGHERVACLLENEANSGSAVAQWKKGLDRARGELVWIAETDDFCEPVFLENLVAEYEQYRADITCCGSLIVDETGLPIDEYRWSSSFFSGERWEKAFLNQGEDEIRNYLACQNTIPNVSAVLFKRTSLDAAIATADGFYYAGDWRIYIEILLSGVIRYVPERMNFFREHQSSTREIRGKNQGRFLQEKIAILDYLLKNDSIDLKRYEELAARAKTGESASLDVQRVAESMLAILEEGHEITVWGYSLLTRSLLSQIFCQVKNAKISQIVDRRLKGTGWFYNGVPLRGPDEIDRTAAAIVLITSQSSVASIHADIVERLGAETRVLTFDDLSIG